jgi:hypothetical protein
LAVALDNMATLTDQILQMHNRLIGLYFKKAPTKNKVLVLAAGFADAINLGVTRMADACPGISPSIGQLRRQTLLRI